MTNRPSYSLLPFNFRRLPDARVVLVSQAGEWQIIEASEFTALVTDKLDCDSPLGCALESKQLLSRGEPSSAVIEMLATKLRTRKGYLRDFTTLHMVVLTAQCNCHCAYCQASSTDSSDRSLHMTPATARNVVRMILQSPSPHIKIEFQGGEPTLNWEALTIIVSYATQLNQRRYHKHLSFVVCTNLVALTQSQLRFFKRHNFQISTSLDGPADLHDANRRSLDGQSAYAAFRRNLDAVRQELGHESCSPLATITSKHIGRLREVVDEYVRLGFGGIFLRQVNPYGRASEAWGNLSVSAPEFLAAYKDALDYIIKLNLAGTHFVEYYSCLLLTRILTPFSTGFVDLQSPTGAGISGAIYDYDGAVYPADEARMLARMGDRAFDLGNVNTNSYSDIFLGSKLKDLVRRTCVEVLPGCATCAYQLFCGTDPIRNYVEAGDVIGRRPTSGFCAKNMGLIDHLLELLQTGGQPVQDVFWAWLTSRPVAEVKL